MAKYVFKIAVEMLIEVDGGDNNAMHAAGTIGKTLAEHQFNLGAWPNGDPIIAEFQKLLRRPELGSKDGEPIETGYLLATLQAN